jgi:hypothetical protein
MDERDVAEEIKQLLERAPAFSDCTITDPLGEAPGAVIDAPHSGKFLVTVTQIAD